MKPFSFLAALFITYLSVSASIAQTAQRYTVVYGGTDGVSIRSTPGGTEIATAHKGSGTSFVVLSPKPQYVDGIPFVRIRMNGWMAKRNLKNGAVNIGTLEDGFGYVTWDGDRNPKDAFIALRTRPSDSQRLAKVFHQTRIKLGSSRLDSSYEWVQAELDGWCGLRSLKGTPLIAPITTAATAHVPKQGSPERQAICDAVRSHWKHYGIKYEVNYLRVHDDWAIFDGVPLMSKADAATFEYGDEPTAATLHRTDGKWRVVHSWCHGDVPGGSEFKYGEAKNLPDSLVKEWNNAFHQGEPN